MTGGGRGASSDDYLKGTIGKDIIAGFAGDDELRGSQEDTLFGYSVRIYTWWKWQGLYLGW